MIAGCGSGSESAAKTEGNQIQENTQFLIQWDFCNSLDSCLIAYYTVLVYTIQYNTERR